MSRKLITLAALATSLAGVIIPSAAMAHDRYYDGGYGGGYYSRDDGWRDRGYDRYDRYEGYGGYGYRHGDDYAYRGYDRGYYRHHRDDRYRCRGDGTAGTIIGAIAGGLIGNGIAGRGDHTVGTILGGGVGAIAGRAIDRSDDRC